MTDVRGAVKPLEAPVRDSRPTRADAEEAVRTLIRYIGDDPTRSSLLETPARVVRAYDEFFTGYEAGAETVEVTAFKDEYSGTVVVRGIEVLSWCEHHMLPIVGSATIGYHPKGEIVGLSKLSRIVKACAAKLTVQEGLTLEIANALERAVACDGVGIVLDAEHFCMRLRGVKESRCRTRTTVFRGACAAEAVRAEIVTEATRLTL